MPPLLIAGLALAAAGAAASGKEAADKSGSTPSAGKLDWGAQQNQAIAGNTSALPGLKNLGSKTTEYLSDETQKFIDRFMPWMKDLSPLAAKNVKSGLEGKVSDATVANIQNKAAAWGVGSGTGTFGGSSQATNLALRNLGLTTEAVQQQAQQNLSSMANWTAQSVNMARQGVMDISRMFSTTEQVAKFNQSERDVAYNSAMTQWSQPSTLGIIGGGLSSFGGLLAGAGAGGLFGGQQQKTAPPPINSSDWWSGGSGTGPFGQPLPAYGSSLNRDWSA